MKHENDNQALLILGGNLGDRRRVLADTAVMIGEQAGIIEQASVVYETEPWGFEHENAFLNQVVLIKTSLEPFLLLDTILAIEKRMGRKRISAGYEARLIDIDVLFYEDRIIRSQRLTIPHPHLHRRRFTLVPLAEIAPGWVHPIMNKTLRELLNICSDKLEVKPFRK